MLSEKTTVIKQLCKSIKLNYLKIGSELKQIRDKELYLENYSTFTDYLESQEFPFSRQHAYRFITVSESYDVTSCYKLTISKLIALTYVPEKERLKILEKSKSQDVSLKEIEETRKRTERLSNSLNKDTEGNQEVFKGIRAGNELIKLKQKLELTFKSWWDKYKIFKDEEILEIKKKLKKWWEIW